MNKSLRILVYLSLISIYTIIFLYIYDILLKNFQFLQDVHFIFVILIYFFVLFVFIGPLLPRKGKKSSYASYLSSIVKSEEKNLFSIKNKSNLAVKLDGIDYKLPLVSKCRCGFILTRNMKKCPNCGRLNSGYLIDNEKIKK